MGQTINAGDVELWVERRGEGPDVLLIAGLSDPAEAWEPQLEGLADRYRLIAFDNRGSGRSPLPAEGCSVATMADDAAGILRALEVPVAHVAGFSGGSAIAQELALRHPKLVRSLTLVSTWASRPSSSGSTRREPMPTAWSSRSSRRPWRSPTPSPREAFQMQLDAFMTHDTLDRLREITAPTLVLAGELDIATPPRFDQVVADLIPDAELVVLPGEAHQPFQESPDEFHSRVDAFWRRVEAQN